MALIRKRLRGEIDQARRAAAERRERAKSTTRAYDEFLEAIAIPTFRQLANVLRAESLAFDVQTPSGGVRLVWERQRDDGIELTLDATHDPPEAMLVVRRTWGGRTSHEERPVKPYTSIERVTEEELMERLLEELRPWLG